MGKRGNGEGTIYKRPNGTWCAEFYIETMRGRKRKSLYGKTQTEVRQKLKKAQHDAEAFFIGDAQNLVLGKWVEYWLENYKRNTLKPTTFDNYKININRHILSSFLASIKLEKIDTNTLQKFYTLKLKGDGKAVPLSSRTVRYLHTIINGAMSQAVKNGLIIQNYNAYVELPKKQQYKIETLTELELQQLLRAAQGTVYFPLLSLEICTGLRKGEILGLRWSDIDFSEREVNVKANLCRVSTESDNPRKKSRLVLLEPKTEKSKRSIPISSDLMEILRRHQEAQNRIKKQYEQIYIDNDVVFTEQTGEFIDPRKLLTEFHKICKKAGVRRCRFHDLRHTFASMLLNEGESPKVIQELLGHSMIATTMDIYTHISKEKKKVALSKLNDLMM